MSEPEVEISCQRPPLWDFAFGAYIGVSTIDTSSSNLVHG